MAEALVLKILREMRSEQSDVRNQTVERFDRLDDRLGRMYALVMIVLRLRH